jgi:hypothetical protein
MPRQTDIPVIQPGTAINADLMNALRRGANQGRIVTGDGSAQVQNIGSRITIGAAGKINPNTEYLVNVAAPCGPGQLYPNLPILGGGCYWGSIFTQGNAIFKCDGPATKQLEVPDPQPLSASTGSPLVSCIVVNVAEDGHAGHALVQSATALGKFAGWAMPKGLLTAVPVLAVRIEPQLLIAAALTLDGGSNGSASAPPSYTYKWPINALTSAQINNADGSRPTGLSPAWARSNGLFASATHGFVYRNLAGLVVLWQCDEAATAATC